MYSLAATINLGNYQNLRLEIAFPMDQLPAGWTFHHVRAWTRAWFRHDIKSIIRRENAGGDVHVSYCVEALESEPEVVPPTHPDLPMPPPDPPNLPRPPLEKPPRSGGMNTNISV